MFECVIAAGHEPITKKPNKKKNKKTTGLLGVCSDQQALDHDRCLPVPAYTHTHTHTHTVSTVASIKLPYLECSAEPKQKPLA